MSCIFNLKTVEDKRLALDKTKDTNISSVISQKKSINNNPSAIAKYKDQISVLSSINIENDIVPFTHIRNNRIPVSNVISENNSEECQTCSEISQDEEC